MVVTCSVQVLTVLIFVLLLGAAVELNDQLLVQPVYHEVRCCPPAWRTDNLHLRSMHPLNTTRSRLPASFFGLQHSLQDLPAFFVSFWCWLQPIRRQKVWPVAPALLDGLVV